MDLFARLVTGLLAAFIMWTVVRALRRGVVFSNFREFTAADNPLIYATAVVVHIGGAALFAATSAGYTLDEISRFVGLSQFPR